MTNHEWCEAITERARAKGAEECAAIFGAVLLLGLAFAGGF